LELLERDISLASHCKDLCDVAVGTTKLQITKTLQHPYCEQFVTLKDFYEFRQDSFHGIKYFYVKQVNIKEN
jgi:hypothetical protein